MECLRIENLTYAHAQASAPSLRDISFSLQSGDFALLYGQSGSGKTTLLRLCKPELTMTGNREGSIFVFGREIPPFSVQTDRAADKDACRIGFVGQHPWAQIVTDRVWHELAFGLESIGTPPNAMRRRVAELACYFGLERRFLDETASLSGGQAQLLNLAAVMATDPELLILDEPTAQLDPIAAENFLSMLGKIHREMGVTVLLCEHRTDAVLPMANRLLILDQGKLIADGTPEQGVRAIADRPRLFPGMPAGVRLSRALKLRDRYPLTLSAGRAALAECKPLRALPPPKPITGKCALALSRIRFRYDRDGDEVLSGIDLSVRYGEILCLLGGNGSGKTTALLCAAGLIKPTAGEIKIDGKHRKFGQSAENSPKLLVQDVTACFRFSTAEKELTACGCDPSTLPWRLDFPLDRHPYDLSGGQQQILALSMLIAAKPKILLLDEPTKGLDRFAARAVVSALRALRESGCAIVLVTHDQEFAAEVADTVALLFRGQIVSTDQTRAFFSDGSFYTTPVRRLTERLDINAVTAEEAAYCLGADTEVDE